MGVIVGNGNLLFRSLLGNVIMGLLGIEGIFFVGAI